MAQWEAARLEAEARLVQKPKNHPNQLSYNHMSPQSIHDLHKTPITLPPPNNLPYLDVLKVWQGNLWSNYSINNESLQSLISKSKVSVATPAMPVLNNVENNGTCDHQGPTKKENDQTEIQMGPLDEFVYANDATFIISDPLRSPEFWEEFVDVLDGGWNSLTIALMASPPASPVS
ncbi:hypothetical protein Tco_0921258 [Tanacetum coccineum]